MTLLRCRHGLAPPVLVCPHVARGDAEKIRRVEHDGEEMWRWVCEGCYVTRPLEMVEWRLLCMTEARERLPECVKVEEMP